MRLILRAMEGRAGQGTVWSKAQRSLLELGGDQQARRLGCWLTDGEKGMTAEIFKGKKDQTLCLNVHGW